MNKGTTSSGGGGYSHSHSYDTSKWVFDDTKHWHASTCGHNLKIDEPTAERIKINVGAALPELEDAPEDYIVVGPNKVTALPMSVPVSYQEVAHCLEKSISKIESAVLQALEATPPELYADIVNRGIYLAGGGALLRGLAKRLTDKITIPFHVADEPLLSVARGTGIALKNVNNFGFLIR